MPERVSRTWKRRPTRLRGGVAKRLRLGWSTRLARDQPTVSTANDQRHRRTSRLSSVISAGQGPRSDRRRIIEGRVYSAVSNNSLNPSLGGRVVKTTAPPPSVAGPRCSTQGQFPDLSAGLSLWTDRQKRGRQVQSSPACRPEDGRRRGWCGLVFGIKHSTRAAHGRDRHRHLPPVWDPHGIPFTSRDGISFKHDTTSCSNIRKKPLFPGIGWLPVHSLAAPGADSPKSERARRRKSRWTHLGGSLARRQTWKEFGPARAGLTPARTLRQHKRC
jgi:hypothetical protein